MAGVQINTRVPPEMRDEIKSLIDAGKYRDQTDFILSAIREKLDRDALDSRELFKKQLVDFLRADSDVRAILKELARSEAIDLIRYDADVRDALRSAEFKGRLY